ncbi:hypothetical protein ABMA28_005088 [Loxostege sticticalis]|uniref:Uncharacterized protein n=1 Tax=Loxostege sticticalis TaxID=481309 RepID=A0ABD0SP87_LOXSC
MAKIVLIVLSLVSVTLAQRPGYAGSMPFGYPVMVTTTTTTQAPPPGATGGLGNRFGDVSTTTQRLPLEANGDAALVNQLMQLPVDQRPFWLINWQALEEHRNKPNTWQIKDNVFLDFGSAPGNRNEDYYRTPYLHK